MSHIVVGKIWVFIFYSCAEKIHSLLKYNLRLPCVQKFKDTHHTYCNTVTIILATNYNYVLYTVIYCDYCAIMPAITINIVYTTYHHPQ